MPTAKGRRRTKDSVRQRILNPTIARAAELADERELPQAFPETLGTHAGKRTAASYLIEAGYDIGWVMDQLGHADGRLTMAVYRQTRRRRKDPRVRELVWSPELEATSPAHPARRRTSRRPRRAATAPAPHPPSSRRARRRSRAPATSPTNAAHAPQERPRGAAAPHVIAGYDAASVARQCGDAGRSEGSRRAVLRVRRRQAPHQDRRAVGRRMGSASTALIVGMAGKIPTIAR